MQINSKDQIAGIPILAVRQFLKNKTQQDWSEESMMQMLKITPEAAEKLLEELHKLEYIDEPESRHERPHHHNTTAGNQFAFALAAKSLKRATADKAFGEFMQRVKEVNEDPYFLYKVVKVVLFGSYLTDAKTVNDVDIALDLSAKEADINRRGDLFEQRREEAVEQGVHFANSSEFYAWPEIEVLKFLKARSRAISLHSLYMEGPVVTQSLHKVVYSEDGQDE